MDAGLLMRRSGVDVAVAVIGAGTRCQRLYGPLLQMLPAVELAGIYSPRPERAAAVASCFGTKAYQ